MAAVRKKTDFIAVHCSATRPNMDIGAKEIRKWHVEGNGWEDIGYHFVIRRDGRVEKGRAENLVGSHVKGFNAVSIGICLIGGSKQDDPFKAENNFTKPQFAALKKLLGELKTRYPNATIQGHRDFPNVAKACPSFDVKAWLSGG